MENCRVWRDGQEIARNVRIADNFIKRLKGLLFDKELQEDQGLLIMPCSQVHTIGMKFNIDVVFLSKSGEVIHTESDMIPGVIGPHIRNCDRILELKNGTIRKKRIARGQRIAFDPIKTANLKNFEVHSILLKMKKSQTLHSKGGIHE